MKKSEAIVLDMISQIKSGRYEVGKKIPSRNRLMSLYDCSRTTIENVIAKLTSGGYLSAIQGSGTILLTDDPVQSIEEVVVVFPFSNNYLEQNHELLLPEYPGDIPRRLLDFSRSVSELTSASQCNRAVVWPLPDIEMLHEMGILRRKNIPQLLLNRDYGSYDAICTDAERSIHTGVSWLRKAAGDDIAIVGRRPCTMRPYQAERVIAFHEVCTSLGIKLRPERIILESKMSYFSPADSVLISQHVFAEPHPRGIFLLNVELAMTLITWAEAHNIVLGRDYYLLVFDYLPDLAGFSGLAMLRQPYERYRNEFLRWLAYRNQPGNRERFLVKLPAELVIGG